jgi:hypothetical protein
MRIGWFVLIALLRCSFSSPALSITRDAVITKAQSEISCFYSSCSSDDTTGIMNNVFHPKYGYAGVFGCSPEATILYEEWPFWNGWPDQYTWYGAPYCYGGNRMGSTCGSFITSGNGVGATKCQYTALNETASWAAGIDCSHFACACLGIGFKETARLPEECNSISWDQLQKGDLLINPGFHVMIFKGWDGSDRSTYTVIQASQSGKRVNEQSGRSKSSDQTSYSPYSPKVIAGDPAASILGFRMEYMNRTLRLTWETECERDTRAFWVERSVSREGPWEAISEPIQARGSRRNGAQYGLLDSSYPGGQLYYRLIEQEEGWRTVVKGVVAVDAVSYRQ